MRAARGDFGAGGTGRRVGVSGDSSRGEPARRRAGAEDMRSGLGCWRVDGQAGLDLDLGLDDADLELGVGDWGGEGDRDGEGDSEGERGLAGGLLRGDCGGDRSVFLEECFSRSVNSVTRLARRRGRPGRCGVSGRVGSAEAGGLISVGGDARSDGGECERGGETAIVGINDNGSGAGLGLPFRAREGKGVGAVSTAAWIAAVGWPESFKFTLACSAAKTTASALNNHPADA